MDLRLLVLAAFVVAAVAAIADGPVVKRSDVVFMGSKSADIYQAYGATMVSWGGHASSDDPKAIEDFKKRVQVAHDLGMRYCAGLAFRTAFAAMIDFDEGFMDSVCRTLDGEPVLVPWLWDHKHKGHPAYWFCTNAPGYREYLKHQTRLAMAADVEGLHIDDYNGTAGTEWRGGCFCPHCMAAFRRHLADSVSPERLKQCGVESLDGFDYGEFLRGRGVTTEDYRRRVEGDLPLGPEFLTFQYQAAAAWVHEIHQYAEGLVGHPLILSVNSSASSPKSLVIAPQLTYFCGEVPRQADSRRAPTDCLFVYKLGDALRRPIVSTSSGQDWAFTDEHKKPGLVRLWIAQAYACGHQLMAPHRQWAYTETKGTHWYQSEPSDYAPLYQFVRAHADLLDDYEAVAQVGLVYSNAAFRANKRATRDACLALAAANVPFRLLVMGDDWLTVPPPAADDLAPLKAVVCTEPLMLDEAQTALLDTVKDRLVTWPDEGRLFSLVPRQVALDGAEDIAILPRAVPGAADRPFVCHLVNQNYDPEADAPVKQTGFRLTLASSLFGGARIAAATLYAPEREPVELTLSHKPDAVELLVPELDLWAVVKLVPERG